MAFSVTSPSSRPLLDFAGWMLPRFKIKDPKGSFFREHPTSNSWHDDHCWVSRTSQCPFSWYSSRTRWFLFRAHFSFIYCLFPHVSYWLTAASAVFFPGPMLGGRFGLFFSARGRGKGSPKGRMGAGGFLMENPQKSRILIPAKFHAKFPCIFFTDELLPVNREIML